MKNSKMIFVMIALVAMVSLTGLVNASTPQNIYIHKNIQFGGGIQTITHSQVGNGNTQILVNYNSGGSATQTISASQTGNGNTQIALNYNTGGSGVTQSITMVSTGSGNYQSVTQIGSGNTATQTQS